MRCLYSDIIYIYIGNGIDSNIFSSFPVIEKRCQENNVRKLSIYPCLCNCLSLFLYVYIYPSVSAISLCLSLYYLSIYRSLHSELQHSKPTNQTHVPKHYMRIDRCGYKDLSLSEYFSSAVLCICLHTIDTCYHLSF